MGLLATIMANNKYKIQFATIVEALSVFRRVHQEDHVANTWKALIIKIFHFEEEIITRFSSESMNIKQVLLLILMNKRINGKQSSCT